MPATRTAAATLALGLVMAVCLLLRPQGRYPTVAEFPGHNNALQVYGDPQGRVMRRSDDGHLALGGVVDGGPAGGAPCARAQDRRSRALQGLSLQQQEEEGGTLAAAPAAGGGIVFPALEESTVMFLHVFKCAGSTLRCGVYYCRFSSGGLGGFQQTWKSAKKVGTWKFGKWEAKYLCVKLPY